MARNDSLTKLAIQNAMDREQALQNSIQGGNRLQQLLGIAAQVGRGATADTPVGDVLRGASGDYQNAVFARRRQGFFDQVRQITQAQAGPSEKINALIGAMAEHGTDYGLGVKGIVDAYGKSMQYAPQPLVGYGPQGQPQLQGYVPHNAKMVPYSMSPQAEQARQQQLDMQRQAQEFQFSKEFFDDQIVKEYRTVRGQVMAMDAMLQRYKSGDVNSGLALDQALISLFNKITDPNSVVRESEYARTPENVSLVNRIIGAIDKITQGGAGISDDDRYYLVQGAKIIANERGNAYNEIYTGTVDTANLYGYDPRRVTRGMPMHTPFEVQGSQARQPTGGGGGSRRPPAPRGAVFYSPSTGKYYDKNEREIT